MAELNILKFTDLAGQIDSHFGLFLNSVVQVDDLTLVLLVSEARVNDNKTGVTQFNEGTEHQTSIDWNPIETDEFCKRYKITFNGFVGYHTIDESYISWSDDEVFTGKFLREFSKSRYLEHAADHLMLEHYEDMTGRKYRHFQVPCLNFIVDILSPEAPEIEEID